MIHIKNMVYFWRKMWAAAHGSAVFAALAMLFLILPAAFGAVGDQGAEVVLEAAPVAYLGEKMIPVDEKLFGPLGVEFTVSPKRVVFTRKADGRTRRVIITVGRLERDGVVYVNGRYVSRRLGLEWFDAVGACGIREKRTSRVAAKRISLEVNGISSAFDVEPEIRGGRLYVAIDPSFARRFGAEIKYGSEAGRKTARVSLNGATIMLRNGAAFAELNGSDVALSRRVFLKGEALMLEARLLARIPGVKLKWSDADKMARFSVARAGEPAAAAVVVTGGQPEGIDEKIARYEEEIEGMQRTAPEVKEKPEWEIRRPERGAHEDAPNITGSTTDNSASIADSGNEVETESEASAALIVVADSSVYMDMKEREPVGKRESRPTVELKLRADAVFLGNVADANTAGGRAIVEAEGRHYSVSAMRRNFGLRFSRLEYDVESSLSPGSVRKLDANRLDALVAPESFKAGAFGDVSLNLEYALCDVEGDSAAHGLRVSAARPVGSAVLHAGANVWLGRGLDTTAGGWLAASYKSDSGLFAYGEYSSADFDKLMPNFFIPRRAPGATVPTGGLDEDTFTVGLNYTPLEFLTLYWKIYDIGGLDAPMGGVSVRMNR